MLRSQEASTAPPRRVNPWNRWERTSPWEPWALGMEPKCDVLWNIQFNQHRLNILRTQEAAIAPQENETQEGDEDSKSNLSADDGDNE